MIWSDIVQLAGAVLLVVGAVLPVVNPPGDAPLFLHKTAGCDAQTRALLAKRVAALSFALLLGTLLVGSLVLRFFGLSLPVIQLSGGAVVCALGWRLLGDEARAEEMPDPHRASAVAMTRAFYPLTMPLTIDPGVLSVAVTVGANHAHTLEKMLVQVLAAVIGAGIVALVVLLTYRYAHHFAARIGHQGMMIMMRLSAFIVMSIGVQIGWNGAKAMLAEIGISNPLVNSSLNVPAPR
jgi:multiple antibiotic resistance protein